jgi:hypothetical protein
MRAENTPMTADEHYNEPDVPIEDLRGRQPKPSTFLICAAEVPAYVLKYDRWGMFWR